MKKIFHFIIAAGLVCALFSSCQKDDFVSVPPTPPSLQSLKIDCSALPTATKSGEVNPAAVFLTFWEGIYNSIINIPVGGFEAAVNVQPQYVDGTWVWDSQYKSYKVRLVASEDGNKYNWELQVSGNHWGRTEYFTWIKGWSRKNGGSGEWSILVGPDDTEVLITSEWVADEGEVKYTSLNCSVDHAIGTFFEFYNNSNVTYTRGASDNSYDSTIVISYSQIGNIDIEVVVEWNSKTGDCRIKSPVFYFDSKWHDWD